jgi:2',3'-cyclic-nucleotide 2'-phosphodiesterase/3'-nucleotidase
VAIGAKPTREVRTVSILHTTDLHGHIRPAVTYEGIGDVGGMARCVTQIRQWRKENPASLLVDVGDVWQGTEVGHATGGAVMMRLFKRLGYDAWVPGNHDFDWGRGVFERAVAESVSPVLGANLTISGAQPGSGAWARWRPWTVKEVGGFRIGLIGLTTPGLPWWLTPEILGGIGATDPVEALDESMRQMKEEKPDAVVVIGHMGWRFQDDFANPVREILRRVRGVDVYLAGHSHQDRPSFMLNDVLCSQADYYGIHCGRVDLTFEVATRKLVERHAFTVLMDSRFAEDPVVLQEAGEDLRKSAETLARKVADLKQPLAGKGRGSPLIEWFCKAFAHALQRAKEPVDGVFHGSFNTGDVPAGPVTVGDCWEMLPYENLLVTAELSAAELLEVVREDAKDKRSDRTLWPFEVRSGAGGEVQRLAFKGEDVSDLSRRFRIAFNSFDSQSAGKRLMRLREIVAAPAAKRKQSAIDTRGALLDYLLETGGNQ